MKRIGLPGISILLIIGLVLTVIAFGAELPETPPAERIAEYLKVFNSGDEVAWRTFSAGGFWQKEADSNIIEQRLGMFKGLYTDLGGVDVVRLEETSPNKISLLCKARNKNAPFEYVLLTVETDTLPPFPVAGLSIRPGENPKYDVPEGKMTDDEMVAYLKDFLDKLTSEDKFSGAVLVAKDDRILFKNAYGKACLRYGVPNKIDTKFNLGSMNKMFTGVAIAQLVQQGKLSFDDPIIKYLPDFPNRETARKVTIHHLLTHTSGMSDYWEELFSSKWWEIKTVPQLADLIIEEPLDFEPGERFGYSNSGPVILGLIIEKITGMSYFDYIREYIYKPAGMLNSDCYEVDRPVPNLAIGYTKMNYNGEADPDGRWYNNLFMHAVKGGPAGGGYSTVEDLFRFAQALKNHILLNREYTELVTAGKVDMGPGMKYAYLFGDENVNGQRIIGHSGGAPGINARLAIYLNSGYTVAVMANYDMAAESVSRKIKEILTR
ncbi:MAG: beta-lactamase family protein [candidate division Zixibacteria bacterium]|nr:beta-lactamase family protein [candidate division Zixibacteria bacterium]